MNLLHPSHYFEHLNDEKTLAGYGYVGDYTTKII